MTDEPGLTGPYAVARLLSCLAHPTRVRALNEFKTAELSPTELRARIADPKISLATLSYHVRALAAGGLIQLTGMTPRRGAMEHHYSLTALGAATLAAMEALGPAITQADRGSRRGPRRLTV
jgi:DNA-binding HxlR family transcriptional regulator